MKPNRTKQNPNTGYKTKRNGKHNKQYETSKQANMQTSKQANKQTSKQANKQTIKKTKTNKQNKHYKPNEQN